LRKFPKEILNNHGSLFIGSFLEIWIMWGEQLLLQKEGGKK